MKPAGRQRRRVITLLAVIAAAAAGGYVVTCAIFPAPILPKSLSVPSLRGVPVDAAIMQLGALGLRARLADTVSDPQAAAGSVAWQSPAPETQLPQGAMVRLGVSSGAATVAVPDIIDYDLALARQVLEAAGLQIGRIDTVRQENDFGIILSTMPTSGTTMRPGDPVQISISSGPASVRVPDVTGLTVAAARDRLISAGLRVGSLEQRFDGKAGTVLSQLPAPGEMVTRESGVNLTISGAMP